MNSHHKKGVSRRSVLAGAGAFGAATLAFPHMAVSQDGKVLTVRSYSDLQILDPAFWLSLPEADIMRSIRVHGKGTDKYDNVRIGQNAATSCARSSTEMRNSCLLASSKRAD